MAGGRGDGGGGGAGKGGGEGGRERGGAGRASIVAASAANKNCSLRAVCRRSIEMLQCRVSKCREGAPNLPLRALRLLLAGKRGRAGGPLRAASAGARGSSPRRRCGDGEGDKGGRREREREGESERERERERGRKRERERERARERQRERERERDPYFHKQIIVRHSEAHGSTHYTPFG